MFQASLQLYRNAYQGLSPRIWWLSLVMLVNRSGTMVLPFLTVYLTSEKGYSNTQAGYAMGAFGAGALLGGFLGGRLTDRFGYFWVQFISLFTSGIMFIVLGYMDTLPKFIACIFVLSTIGESFRPANSAAIAAYSNDGNRTRSYSLNRLAINLGFAVGPAVGGIVSEYSFTWLFWLDGCTCMVAALILFITLSGDRVVPQKRQKQELKDTSSAFRDRIFLTGMFYLFLVCLCFLQLFSMVPVYYKQELHLSQVEIGMLMALNGIVIFLFEMVLVYKLENRTDPFYYIMAGSFLMGLSFVMLNIAPGFAIALIGILVVTVGEMLLFPFINNFWVSRSNQYNRGQYASVFTMSFAAAHVLSPTFSAYISDHAGFYYLWIANFLVCSVGTLGFIHLKKMIAKHE
jgi:predicted MFS family arabinose efflux permease